MTQRRALVDIDGKLQETPTGDTLYGAGDISGAVALAPDTSARNVIQPTGAAIIPLIAKGYAAQSANLQEWQNSGGSVLASVASSGLLTASSATFTGPTFIHWGGGGSSLLAIQHNSGSDGNSWITCNTYNGGIRFWVDPTGFTTFLPTTITASAAGNIPLIVKGASAQSAYLQQWQNSAGSALASIDASGKINATAGTITAPGGGSSAFNVVSVAGHGGPLFTVEPLTGGYFTVQVDGKVGAGVYINPAARIHSKATAAAEIASIFQGTTSQTANLTEWQDSSGTVVGSISADGQTVAFGNASSGTTTITTKATDPGMSMLIQPATNSASGASGDLNLKSAASSYASYGPGNINIIVPDVPFTGSRTNGEIYLKGCDNTTAGPTGGATPGGRIRLLAGYGMIGTTNTGGTGGEISITTGAGGVCTKAGSAAGAGGALSLAGGAGGVQSASTGGTGGAGGSLALTAGVGGAQTGSSGTRTGGAGGNIVLTAGAGGTGATANGADGKVIVRAFSGQTSNLQEWQNSSAAIKASVAADGSVATASDAYFYLGDSATNGSWRIGRSGNDLVFERRESGSWVTKSTVTP